MDSPPREEPSFASGKRGRPKSIRASLKGKSQSSDPSDEEKNKSQNSLNPPKKRGRPPKSANSNVTEIESDNQDCLKSSNSPAIDAVAVDPNPTQSNSAGRNGSKKSKSEFETPTSRRSCGKPKRFEDADSPVTNVRVSDKGSVTKSADGKNPNSSAVGNRK
ncbi:hypothetical protein EGW08_004487, partial [Elysia chlorotica]